MKNQHNTNYTKLQTNSDSTVRIAWRFSLATRQFMAEPKTWGKIGVLLGGTFMPARWFRGENLEFAKNSVIQQGFHAIQFIQFTVHYSRITTIINNSPYLEFALQLAL